jgi:regulator of sigma E protease
MILGTILIFFAVLFVLILVHEWGHFIVAKKTGMRVDEFGIGFPPKIKGWKKGETEYSLNWLPIGGFVRIWGENYEDGVEGSKELSEADRSRAFSARPKWAQALVLVAGVTMNVLFAWLLLSIAFLMNGVMIPVEQAVVDDVLADGPAVSIPVDATITKVVFGEEVLEDPTPAMFSQMVAKAAPESLTITYSLEGEEQVVALTPVQGLLETDPEKYLVGVSFEGPEVIKVGVVGAVIEGFKATVGGFSAICVGLWSLISDMFAGQADMSSVGGPVLIATMTGEAASYGLAALLTFTAFISLNLAVINLLPIPALDGGRLVFVLIEVLIRRPIPAEWAGRVNLAGFVFLMLLMLAVTYKDIAGFF